MNKKRVVAIIQARCGSERLPNKVMQQLANKPLLEHIVNRSKSINGVDLVVVATTTQKHDNIIEDWCVQNHIACFRGDEDNVLSRYYEAATKFKADVIIRITADDPFKDIKISSRILEVFLSNSFDFVYNNKPASFPEGLDVEIFTYEALKIANEHAIDNFEKEHVTQYFHRHPEKFKQHNVELSEDLSSLRWTIDEKKDFEMVDIIYQKLYKENVLFGMLEILTLLEVEPEISTINLKVSRSSMYKNNDKVHDFKKYKNLKY